MCVLDVSLGSKVRPRILGCVAMGSALFFLGGCSTLSCLAVWEDVEDGPFFRLAEF